MTIFAIDPSNILSSYIIWNGKDILGKSDNIILNLKKFKHRFPNPIIQTAINDLMCEVGYDGFEVVIEDLQCFGMPVGKSVFETAKWIGRFQEYCDILGIKNHTVYRTDIKMHHCNSTRAKDSNIRQVLIDRFGKQGTKKNPGMTYGLAKDLWSAFAIAVYWYDIKESE